MKPDSGCSFVVVQHLSPDFKSLMEDLLSRQTAMAIHRAEEGLRLQPNAVYLIPPKKLMTVSGRCLHLRDRQSDRSGDMAINAFMESLAADVGAKSVAIVLSGTGSDGSDGLRAIKSAGGLVIVQDPATAEFDGMPTSAIATGVADYILTPDQMPAALLAFCEDPSRRITFSRDGADSGSLSEEGEHAPVFRQLKRAFGLDFSHYKISTVERRIKRRASLAGMPSAADYIGYLEKNPAELNLLYRDLLIGVTEFFRDISAFKALRREVYEPLCRRKDKKEIRVWIAGCATGEEAYSHAILLSEIAREIPYDGRISIFATDAHRHSLEVASAGVYSSDRLSQLTPEMRDRYFTREKDGAFRINPEIRQRVVFAPHNLLSDPPFTKMDVVSCRNLLIYLSLPAQERVISLLHYSLHRGGALMLGLSEGPGRLSPDFDVLNAKEKLYRKNRESRVPEDLQSPLSNKPVLKRTAAQLVAVPSNHLPRGLLHAYGQLLDRNLPPGFVINTEGDILQFIGSAAKYLEPQSGPVSENLLVRTSGDLRLAISTLLPKAARREAAVLARLVEVSLADGTTETVDVQIETLPEDRTGVFLLHVSLRPTRRVNVPTAGAPVDSESNGTQAFASASAHRQRIIDLEQELTFTKESLQTTVEELQTTNEELQAANEEMLAANEELQSTNEELHSVNEELYTVNAEFERKNVELGETVADLDNLLAATDAGTVFLDHELRIRRFNPAIQSIFNLLPQDIGRSIEQIAYHLADHEQMISKARHVLETGEPVEQEIRTRDGRWFFKRTLPFRSGGTEPKIDGVVLTFTRIDRIKRVQEKLDLAMEYSRLVWWEWDLVSNRLETHSAGWCILGYELECLSPSAETWFSLTHPSDVEQVRSTLSDCLSGKVNAWECEHRLKAKDGHWRWVLNKGRVVERHDDGKPRRMLGSTQDIHLRREAQIQARDLAEAFQQADTALYITSTSGEFEFVNMAFTEVTGFSLEDVKGQTPRVLKSGEHPPEHYASMWKSLLAGEVWIGEVRNRRKDGTLFWARSTITPLRDEAGNLTRFMAAMEDITLDKAEKETRRQLETQLAQAQKMETLGTLAGGIAHDFNNLLTGILGFTRLARNGLPSDHPVGAHLDLAERTSLRAADLVKRILAFSRHLPESRSEVTPAVLIEELLPMLRSSLPSTVELQFNNSARDVSLMVDSGQLQQVIANLCTNAAQAIGNKPGIIRIGVSLASISDHQVLVVGELVRGSFLRLEIADTGPGIDPAIISKVFNPFFTTKPPGEGTGLGLSIVHNMVIAHGGAISLTSSPGVGTTFVIYLPINHSGDPATAIRHVGEAPLLHTQDALKGAHIYVVDDEDFVAEMVRATVASAGATTRVFRDSVSCLEAILNQPDGLQMLITDQTMPKLMGSDLVAQLRAKGIKLPVIIISGYSRSLNTAAVETLSPCAFIPKPFELNRLISEAARLMGRDMEN